MVGENGENPQTNVQLGLDKTEPPKAPRLPRRRASGPRIRSRPKIVVNTELQSGLPVLDEAQTAPSATSTEEPVTIEPESKTNTPEAAVSDPVNATKEKSPLKKVDVIGQKDKIIPVLQKLAQIDRAGKDDVKKAEDMKIEEAAIELLPLWEGLDLTPKNVSQLWNSQKNFTNIFTHDAYAFSHFGGHLDFSAIFAAGAFESSKGARVSDFLAISNKAFAGADERVAYSAEPPIYSSDAHVTNSVIFGKDIFKYAKKGVISHSIIGGEGALTNSHFMTLVDTYEITPDGVYYYDDVTFSGRFVRDEKYRVDNKAGGVSAPEVQATDPATNDNFGPGKLAPA